MDLASVFQNPFGLLGLLALPAVLALHFYRRRSRPRVVSALFLWGEDALSAPAGRKRERLERSASLACELCAALALALALAGPRGCGGEAAHLVVLLDDSASMGAEVAPGQSIAERARELVRERAAALPSGSRISLIASGRSPRILAGPAGLPQEALAALVAWQPAQPGHAFEPALALAVQLAGGGAALFVSDREPARELPPEIELVALGEPLANAAIVRATRARSPGGGERVELELAQLAPESARLALELRARGATLARREIALGPGAREFLAFELPAGIPTVEARLEPGGALAGDDRAWLAPAPHRPLAIASLLDPELARSLGLGSEEAPLERLLRALPDVYEVSAASAAHLLLEAGDASSGGDASAGGAHSFSFAFAALGSERSDFVGPFLAERAHPLLHGLALQGLVWSADPELRLAGEPLVLAGELPLLCETREADRRRFVANLDPLRSTLFSSPDWPILLANLAELRRRELPGPERTNLALGEPLVVRGEAGRRRALVGEGVHIELEARALVVVEELGEPGPYALQEEGREPIEIGISFLDASESDLRGLASTERRAELAPGLVRADTSALALLLAALALAFVLADWALLSGRGLLARRNSREVTN